MRIKYLDGIKGIAAIAVFLCHYKLMRFPTPAIFHDSWLATWFMSGGYAVALFLIVSGLSAMISIQKKINDYHAISKSIINRYFRFAIPFSIVFTILYLTNFTGLYSCHIQAGEILHSEVLKTAFWPVNIVGFCKSLVLSPINPDFWDAPLWMMKYVFLSTYIAILMMLCIQTLSKNIQLLVLTSSLIIFSFYDIFFYGVLLGVIFAHIYLSYTFDPLSTKHRGQFIGVVCLILAILSRYYLPGCAEFVNITSAAFFLLSVHCISALQKIFSVSLMQYLGKISFGVFLWHWPILCSLTSFLFLKAEGVDTTLQFLITFVPSVVCVIIISHISEKLIEKRLSNWISERIMKFIYR